MLRAFPAILAITIIAFCSSAHAQFGRYGICPSAAGQSPYTVPTYQTLRPSVTIQSTPIYGNQGYQVYRPQVPVRAIHRPDVIKLDRYADQLEQVAKHLHADVLRLGKECPYSAAIDEYVCRLDQLNEHLHDLLHRSADRGHLSTSYIRYVSNDIRTIRKLGTRLDVYLEHCRYETARPEDVGAIDHMRQIISNELFVLIRRMEHELDGDEPLLQSSRFNPSVGYRTARFEF